MARSAPITTQESAGRALERGKGGGHSGISSTRATGTGPDDLPAKEGTGSGNVQRAEQTEDKTARVGVHSEPADHVMHEHDGLCPHLEQIIGLEVAIV